MTRLKVRVTPRGSKETVIGWREDTLVVKLTAPPVEGAANRACVDFLAKTLGVKRSQVNLISGEKSRDKVFEIDGLDETAIKARVKLFLPT